MRTPERIVRQGGVRWKVRYRHGGKETSETFIEKRDAETFASLMGSGHPAQVREALAWLERRQAGQNGETATTFAAWIETYVEQLTGVTSRTRDDYRALHRRYLTHLDDIPIDQINRLHVTSLVNDMERNGLAPKTIKNTVFGLLAPALALAVDEDMLLKNPTKRVRLPEMKLDEDDEDEARFLTYEEYAALAGTVRPYYLPLVQFLVGTGMRWSEATAVQRRHVDLEAGTVRVQQAWKKIKGGWELGPPKAKKSRRTVNAATVALVAIAPLLEGKGRTDFAFLGPQGGTVRHGNFYNRIWVPACEGAGFDPRPRIHDLRHTHASWLISNGASLEAVQDQLGHESIQTTRGIYGHLLPAVGVEVGRIASAAMERALAGPALSDPVTLAIEQGESA